MCGIYVQQQKTCAAAKNMCGIYVQQQKTCAVYMWGSKKHVRYTCAAAKNMCGRKVMNMYGSLG
jgi:hypothetical protein